MKGDPADAVRASFDPDRLRQARLVRGLKKLALAQMVGVTPAAVGQYELGRVRPSAAVLAKASLALGFPLEFFMARYPKGNTGEEHAHFRRLRSTSARSRSMQVARLGLLDELVERVERQVELPKLDLPIHEPASADRTEVEGIAAWLRIRWGLGKGPIGNVVRLLESKGIVVVRLASEAEGIDAYSWRAGSRPIVVLTRDKADNARSNFDAAHELGHLVMHQEPDAGSRSLEDQAQMFAAGFLTPAETIREELPSRFDVPAYVALKHRWGVSVQALLFRARTLGNLSEPAYRRAMAKISAWGWRTNEPADIRLADEPILLSSALRLLQTELQIGIVQLASDLSIPPALVYSFVSSQVRPKVEVQTPD